MKKTIIVIFCAIVVGSICAFIIFNKVALKNEIKKNESIAKAFQIGAFTNYDNAKTIAERNNGIVIEDTGIYRVYVSILSDEEAIAKLEEYYNEIGLNYYLKDLIVGKEYINSIVDEQNLLKNSSHDTYVVLNNSILSKYQETI